MVSIVAHGDAQPVIGPSKHSLFSYLRAYFSRRAVYPSSIVKTTKQLLSFGVISPLVTTLRHFMLVRALSTRRKSSALACFEWGAAHAGPGGGGAASLSGHRPIAQFYVLVWRHREVRQIARHQEDDRDHVLDGQETSHAGLRALDRRAIPSLGPFIRPGFSKMARIPSRRLRTVLL